MLNDILILMRQELGLTAIILLLLLLKLGKERPNTSVLNLMHILLLGNLVLGFVVYADGTLFGDMFKSSNLIILQKSLLNLGLLLISLQAHAWLKTHEHVTEFYLLLLTSVLGMDLMLSGNNWLMFYLGLEMSTIPLAAAANFALTERRSSESAFKLIISSAFSSGLLLMGISFIYGISGTLTFAGLHQHLNGEPLEIFAFVLVLAGLAFKVSAVPFHLWTADVYEGAPVAVTSFLSVVSKSSVVIVLINVLYKPFNPLASTWFAAMVLLAVLTILVGNLFALRQENIKRFMAFSSIAQVGFILVAILGISPGAYASVIYFLLIYLFSNLAAFGVIALVSQATGKESISDYKGFYKSNPVLSWVITIALFSLAGVPPTAGFFGKFFLLMSGAAKGSFALIGVAAANMVISFYYYLRIVKNIFMDEPETSMPRLQIPLQAKLAFYICIAGILITGLAGIVFENIFLLGKGL